MNHLIAATKKHPKFDIDICGWSYGGAMAILAAEDFNYRTNKKPNVYTFGAPKPLFGEKSRKYILSCCNEVKQYSHINDLVTYLAPFFGYKALNKITITNPKFSILKVLKPKMFHTIYFKNEIYNFLKP